MGPRYSLPNSQEPFTCLYPDIHQTTPSPPSHVLKFHLNYVLLCTPRYSKSSISPRFPHQISVCTSPLPIRATFLAHLIRLALITHIIYGEEHKSYSLLSFSLLHSPVTSFLLGPNEINFHRKII